MDPTMQFPIRRTVPLPPLSEGFQVTIPSGPHQYSTRNWVGNVSLGHTPEDAFAALSTRATPFQSGPSVDGGVVDIPILGPVRQLVDPDHLTIVNTTMPGHLLHPGNVFRSIVRQGDDLYAVTHGYGTGALPKLNGFGGPRVWNFLDLGVRGELNPGEPLYGYPMDEMNAAVDVGSQSNSSSMQSLAGPASGTVSPDVSQKPRPLGQISNQPMPDWPIPPPIFNTER